jgi:hypothetical protein
MLLYSYCYVCILIRGEYPRAWRRERKAEEAREREAEITERRS